MRVDLTRGGDGILNRPAISAALEADNPATITDPSAKAFRSFADATGADRQALAATQKAPMAWTPRETDDVTVPVLVVAGDADTLAGSPDELARALPNARGVTVPGDHLSAAIKPGFTNAVVEFLGADRLG